MKFPTRRKFATRKSASRRWAPAWLLALLMALPVVAPAAPEDDFVNPPGAARPGVYWYFMDGNLNREEMVRDLESMAEVGLGNLVFLEVDVGVPRGPVKFMSDQWQDLFVNAVRTAERLGIDITLGAGPGWTGSGGPWVTVSESMQHLVFSTVDVLGPQKFHAALPLPKQRSTRWHNMKDPFYADVRVFAFPSCAPVIDRINEKALYERDPYSSFANMRGTSEFFLPPTSYPEAKAVDPGRIIDVTNRLDENGRLRWDIPAGRWTIIRMGRRTTGASTRPAPLPGVGFEHDKFSQMALENHFDHYCGRLLAKIGARGSHGWTTLHMDSWEMGAQNWTPAFIPEFSRRRGYDPSPWLIAYSGRAVKSVELTERFLWDLRLTAQELVLENYAGHLKTLGARHGFQLSIEPYDMNPTADLDLGAVADVPMCEFWGAGYGFDSSFSCIESGSVAHVMGRPIVSAEAFTGIDQWQQYPGAMKNQGDWAFAIGVNRFVYHTFAHQPLGDDFLPGMTMGPYGVHWDRHQTWWPMADGYHAYITRCSNLLRQGVTVSDILYLTPEGAPHVFRPPPSALAGAAPMPDKRGYGFDGCSPNMLMSRAGVKDGMIVFPGGTSYRLLVLPRFETMTQALLKKIIELVEAGATVLGAPPHKSPSLSGYPGCDAEVQALAARLWGDAPAPERAVGLGRIILDPGAGGKDTGRNPPSFLDKIFRHLPNPFGIKLPAFAENRLPELYPPYEVTAGILKAMGVPEDFMADGPVRYGHRSMDDREIYFVANTTDKDIAVNCAFRVVGAPELWDPVTAEIRPLPQFTWNEKTTTVPMRFAPHQSFFVIFPRGKSGERAGGMNFAEPRAVQVLSGKWEVAFDPKRGGPAGIIFDELSDWTARPERGIKYYSGIAVYSKTFELDAPAGRVFLDLGVVHDLARVRLNGNDLGVVWCAPWRVEITGALHRGSNRLEIEVANRWPNRLLGDTKFPDKNTRTVKWDEGYLGGREYITGRYTFATRPGPGKLLPSGLIGPVRVMVGE